MLQNLLKLLVPLSKYNILKIKVIFWYFKRKYVFWYIHIYFMKASLRFLMDNQIGNEHYYSPHYVSYVN